MTRPSPKTWTVWATCRANCMAWVTTTMVRPSRGQVGHDGEHLGGHPRVERAGRLVEEDRLRLHRQGPGDRDPLLLAAGELRGACACSRSDRPTRSSSRRARSSACRGVSPRT